MQLSHFRTYCSLYSISHIVPNNVGIENSQPSSRECVVLGVNGNLEQTVAFCNNHLRGALLTKTD